MDDDIKKIIYRALRNNNFLTLHRMYADGRIGYEEGDLSKFIKELDNKLQIKLTE